MVFVFWVFKPLVAKVVYINRCFAERAGYILYAKARFYVNLLFFVAFWTGSFGHV